MRLSRRALLIGAAVAPLGAARAHVTPTTAAFPAQARLTGAVWSAGAGGWQVVRCEPVTLDADRTYRFRWDIDALGRPISVRLES